MSVELREHQTRALGLLRDGCILRGDVGSGKSIVAMAYYYTKVVGGKVSGIFGETKSLAPSRPRDLYIITTSKKRNDLEWDGELARFALSRDKSLSISKVNIVVDSWNNIEKYREIKDAFFIFDEQKAIGGGSWAKSFVAISKNNQWIMLTATPGDSWIEYVPVFLAKGYFRNRTEFITRHVVYSRYAKFPKIERYVDTAPLERYRRSVIVDMPFTKHTTRHIRTVKVEHDEAALKRIVKERWHIFEDRPLKDAAEMFALMRKIVNTDPSRLGEMMNLVEKHDRLIVFYQFNYELEILRILSTVTGIETREWNGHKHEPVPDGEKWLYFVQYTSGSEAWNCITTNVTVFYSRTYSYKVEEQSKGRIDRMNTPYKDLYYYILMSDSSIDKAVAKALRAKQNFNEKIFIEKSGETPW